MSDIFKGSLGEAGEYRLEFKDKNLYLVASFDGPGIDGEVSIMLDPEHFVDELAKAIPGKLDDAVLEMLKEAFFEDGIDGK